jgi:hypothetical protein
MASFDRAGEAFLRALDEAGRSLPADNEVVPAPPRPQPAASVDFGPDPGGGGEARWDFAMQWTDERAPPSGRPALDPAPETNVCRSDPAVAIAEELGIGAGLTPQQIASRWRSFVWRNHPDRQPADERDRAGARVAIANTLYDEARRELAKAR